ncbi:unnamed protein product [Gongylonema pulchrum]|uniref:Uncharacterized protein n=1 Tax=Gongylonema pulchrum TaxID=637853 RepID=A0A183D8D3_9BILA|nr:unnamed protein product [Gongylonema pulchrum]
MKVCFRNCDPVLNLKRGVRVWELKERLTDCTCRNRSPCATVRHQSSESMPGWWAFEIQKAVKRSVQASLRVSSGKRNCPTGLSIISAADALHESAAPLNTDDDSDAPSLSKRGKNDDASVGAVFCQKSNELESETAGCNSSKSVEMKQRSAGEIETNADPEVAECLCEMLRSHVIAGFSHTFGVAVTSMGNAILETEQFLPAELIFCFSRVNKFIR